MKFRGSQYSENIVKKISKFFVNAFAPVIRAPLTTRRCTTPPRTTPRPSPTARTGPTTAPARCSGEQDQAIAPQNGSPRVFVLYPYTTLPPSRHQLDNI